MDKVQIYCHSSGNGDYDAILSSNFRIMILLEMYHEPVFTSCQLKTSWTMSTVVPTNEQIYELHGGRYFMRKDSYSIGKRIPHPGLLKVHGCVHKSQPCILIFGIIFIFYI
jgi:hypothetical protein